jgi:hypothetical protein
LAEKRSLSSRDPFWIGWDIGLGFVRFFETILSLIVAFLTRTTWTQPFSGHEDWIKTRELYCEVEVLHNKLGLDQKAQNEFAAHILIDLFKRIEKKPPSSVIDALIDVIFMLMVKEGAWDLIEIDWQEEPSLEEGVLLRKHLRMQKRFLQNYERYSGMWREKLLFIFTGVLMDLPEGLLDEEDEDDDVSSFAVSFIDCAEAPEQVIEHTIVGLWDDEVMETGLFDDLRWQVRVMAMVASGLDPENPDHHLKPVRLPTEVKGKSPTELVELYLRNTPFGYLLSYFCTIRIPLAARFEHCHIVGGTGHGKTQLLENLILEDLRAALESKRGICVIDSQGDLLNTISHLAYFSPGAENSLADRLVIIDPNDTDYPVALNMFDMNLERLDQLKGAEKERMVNATIELYEYMFGALLGAELTGKQGLIFKYIARLMMVIPGASVHTLRALMENSEQFRPYVEKLHGTARSFFETQFFSPQFVATKKQILARLWGVLSNPTFERMFSHEKNKVDLFAAMQEGKIVLINTAKDLLQKDGSQILGRFFIALIAQATLQRATIPAEDRYPCFVYIDEAHEYFDDHIGDLVNQARKYRVGLTLAHQNLDQLSMKLRADVLASTSVKFAGGVSAKDAVILGREMNATPEFIQQTRKRATSTEFACWIKHVTQHPVRLSFLLGKMEMLPVMSDGDYDNIVDRNRKRYCAPKDEVVYKWMPELPPPKEAEPQAPPPTKSPTSPRPPTADIIRPVTLRPAPRVHEPTQEPVTPPQPKIEPIPELGRGGRQHKYLQAVIKNLAEERGYRAIIERQINEGTGSVDISLENDDKKIACEVSITTPPEHEVRNIRKCLTAGYDTVIVLSAEGKHLRKLKEYAVSELTADEIGGVHFFLLEEFIHYIDKEVAESAGSETTVKGYKVKVNYTAVSEAEQKNRRQQIAKVILQSMKRLETET